MRLIPEQSRLDVLILYLLRRLNKFVKSLVVDRRAAGDRSGSLVHMNPLIALGQELELSDIEKAD